MASVYTWQEKNSIKMDLYKIMKPTIVTTTTIAATTKTSATIKIIILKIILIIKKIIKKENERRKYNANCKIYFFYIDLEKLI